MTSPVIRHARSADAGAVAGLIAEAFADLDLAAWLIPAAADRARVLSASARMGVDRALDFGEIHIVDEFAAVAVWVHHPEPGFVPDRLCYDAELLAACGPHTHRFRVLDDRIADHHPHSYPHHHLAFLATRPGMQNRGLGARLLQYHHTTLDLKGFAAYVEAHGSHAGSLFERHGYESISEPFSLPGNGPSVYPLWREPRLS